MFAHRLGMVPLAIDPQSMEPRAKEDAASEVNTVVLKLSKTCTTGEGSDAKGRWRGEGVGVRAQVVFGAALLLKVPCTSWCPLQRCLWLGLPKRAHDQATPLFSPLYTTSHSLLTPPPPPRLNPCSVCLRPGVATCWK